MDPTDRQHADPVHVAATALLAVLGDESIALTPERKAVLRAAVSVLGDIRYEAVTRLRLLAGV